ncbi:flavin reductase family protein [Nonomuraea sp. K274]|uniref:Flavin reductase family protein n=1 Tax=Nonomuraea cypriaca TaxID=1187855 RepID=A0A931EVT9_9ACTN|nr:flavin reductase family protein [Nonomuraea cypriaca]MBF8184505.1 flavin reductase family protein [Nonomuraea cypriaca]
MSRLAGAVSIVATGSSADPAGWRGMTATAVCSLCAEPPSLVVCLNRGAGTYRLLRSTGLFSVNVLASRHVGLAQTFAGHRGLNGAERFGTGDWTAGTRGVPVLADALTSFECRVSESLEYGTHTLLIGSIETAYWTDGDAEPLVYHRHRFLDLGREIETTGGPTA